MVHGVPLRSRPALVTVLVCLLVAMRRLDAAVPVINGFVCSEKLDYDGHPIYSGNATNPLTNTLEGCAVVAAANCNFPGAFFVFKKAGECLIRTDFPVETFKDVQYGDQQGYGGRTGPDDDVVAACVCTFGYINIHF